MTMEHLWNSYGTLMTSGTRTGATVSMQMRSYFLCNTCFRTPMFSYPLCFTCTAPKIVLCLCYTCNASKIVLYLCYTCTASETRTGRGHCIIAQLKSHSLCYTCTASKIELCLWYTWTAQKCAQGGVTASMHNWNRALLMLYMYCVRNYAIRVVHVLRQKCAQGRATAVLAPVKTHMGYILHTTYYILHTTYCILHTACCILHTTYHMLHTTLESTCLYTTYYILHYIPPYLHTPSSILHTSYPTPCTALPGIVRTSI